MDVWLRFQQYKVPLIELLRATPKEAVCQVFENVNQGGVPLTVFELVTAMYAASEFDLRKDWETRAARLRKYPVLEDVDGTAFLTAATLSATHSRSLEERRLNRLPAQRHSEVFTRGIRGREQQDRGGLDSRISFPEPRMCLRNANPALPDTADPTRRYLFSTGEDFEKTAVHAAAHWYWCGVFGELVRRR